MENQDQIPNPDEQEQEEESIDEESPSVAEGPFKVVEGDNLAELYGTDVIPGSEEEVNDLELNPSDDPNTNVSQEDIDTLEGMDQDDDFELP